MADDQQQINLPSLAVILVLSGLIIRYLFFSPSAGTASSSSRSERAGDTAALMRQREAAAERIQQMFPQVDRRTALWDLQRTGGNVAATTERILAGRLETPPITFQPPPPPTGSTSENSAATPQSKPAAGPAHPDLITRYNLQDKLRTPAENSGANNSGAEGPGKGAGKAWSSSREERESLLQKRRDQMILEARRKMEAKLAAEKSAGNS
ncbi:hypothetical protein N657DRAFT_642965 [Parathielavia appendiculata]|uniref:Coupling of ubiquitin conjugation to ER degradation protein 1 n=1 Tax=Parathielavia appendiculata TaxID=2587402 RepID=A0AAN6U4A8_9PEZI|nr:hypothetical protein N657DRAFT_642965 [Parathielavia appendiculata]